MFTKFQGNRYGGCSLDHLDKIQRGEKMQEIKNFANINEEGLDYALGKAKSVYTDTQNFLSLAFFLLVEFYQGDLMNTHHTYCPEI